MLRAFLSEIDYPRVIICLFIGIANFSCSSMRNSVSSNELMRPLSSVRKGVYFALQNSVKNRSENGRTYFSEYHRPGMNLKLSAYKQAERAQVAISILGDRRPYRVVVLYKVDRVEDGKYRFDRYDKDLAQKYLNKVTGYLASRPEERDIIDDFRPY